jgi:hypothetical protein
MKQAGVKIEGEKKGNGIKVYVTVPSASKDATCWSASMSLSPGEIVNENTTRFTTQRKQARHRRM